MRQRRHRLSKSKPPINVHIHLDDGLPKCPFCGEGYDRAIPIIGAEGVTEAYVHDDDYDATLHFSNSVLRDVEHDIDCDEFCFFEIG